MIGVSTAPFAVADFSVEVSMSCPALFAAFALISTGVASGSPLTILLEYDHQGSAAAGEAMQREVRHLLGGRAQVSFETLPEAASVVAGRLVVLRLHGYCTMGGPVTNVEPGIPLGSTAVSEGWVLPFADVQCDRIRASLNGVVSLTPERYQRELGTAMGRVVVHELYHILSNSRAHTRDGLTKRALSAAELLANTSSLGPDVLDDAGENQRSR